MHAGTFLLAAMLVAGVHGIFDCTRDANLCPATQACDFASFKCSCDGTHEGDRCDVTTALIDQGGCTPTNPCVRGVCYDDGAGNALCSCPDDYIGATCADRRYDANCNSADSKHTDITLNADIAAGTTFVGRAYIDGFAGTAACELTCTGAGVCTLAEIAFIDATCGDAAIDGDIRTRKIVLEYSTGDTTSVRDELISIKCSTSDTLDITAAVTATFNSGNLGQTDVDLVAVDTDLTFTATPAANVLGETVTVTADLSADGAKKFKQILVKSCKIANAGTEHLFIDSYCLLENYLAADATGVVRAGTTHTWSFEAIRMNDQDNLDVTCTIRVCVVEADCAPVGGCTRGDAGVGRKKRQAENVQPTSDSVVDKQVMTRIRVLERIAASNTEKKQAAADAAAAACYQNWQTTATIIALAVSLMLVLIVCMVLIVKTVLRRKTVLYGRDESPSTATLPHLPAYK